VINRLKNGLIPFPFPVFHTIKGITKQHKGITENGEKRIYLYLTVFVELKPIYESIDFKIYDDGYSTPYGLQSYSEMKLNICKEIFEDKN